MANRNSPFGIAFHKMDSGVAAPAHEDLLLGSNVGCVPGDALYIDSNGVGQLCTTSLAPWGFAVGTITAIAGTRQTVQIMPAILSATFKAQMGGTTNVTQAFIGKKGFLTGGTGAMAINAANTVAGATLSNAPYQIMRLLPTPGNALSTYAIVELKVVRSAYAGHRDPA